MTSEPVPPRLERRRKTQFAAELKARARSWVPDWDLASDERDFGQTLLAIAARFDSEVAQRLDGAGDKMKRGFLDWLALRGLAARPARVPVAFKLNDAAQEPVAAQAPVSLQVGIGASQVALETETDLHIVPGRLEMLVGIDAASDAYYVQAPGITSLAPFESVPTQWRLKSFAAAGSRTLQIDPDSGLVPGMLVQIANRQHRVEQAEGGLVTLASPLPGEGLAPGTVVRKVTTFAPYGDAAPNEQQHALYLGHADVLNVEAAASIEIFGAQSLVDAKWQYWGKVEGSDDVDWQPLQPSIIADTVVLRKGPGSIEPRTIGTSASSRWLRAVKPTVLSPTPQLQVDQLLLRVNGSAIPACDSDKLQVVPAEAMANTTPLVLDEIFYPLGREPRMFDAFYLGSTEAFSKKGATAQLCFQLADSSFAWLAALRTGFLTNPVLAGIGRDSALHLYLFNRSAATLTRFGDRDPLQPPASGYGGVPLSGPTVALDPRPLWRPPVWSEGFDFLVAAAAGNKIWAWHECAQLSQLSGWVFCGELPFAGAVEALVFLGAPSACIVALQQGKMCKRDWPLGAPWAHVPTVDGGGHAITLKSLAPMLAETAQQEWSTSAADGLVGVSNVGKVYRVTSAGVCTEIVGLGGSAQDVAPIGVVLQSGKQLYASAQAGASAALTAVQLVPPLGPTNVVIGGGSKIQGLDATIVGSGGRVHFLASVDDAAQGSLAAWSPFPAGAGDELHTSSVPAGLGPLNGGPTVLPGYVIIPTSHSDALVGSFDLTQRLTLAGNVEFGIVAPASAPALVPGDHVMRIDAASQPAGATIAAYGVSHDGEVYYSLDKALPSDVTTPILAYRASTALAGHVTAASTPDLELLATDNSTVDQSYLYVEGQFRQATLDKTLTPWVAQLVPPLAGGLGPVSYMQPAQSDARLARPLVTMLPGSNNWDAKLLEHASLLFTDAAAVPRSQRATAVHTDATNHPTLLELGADWSTPPAPLLGAGFVLDAVVTGWTRVLGDSSTNPKLSWEYWNGKGWWSLDVDPDETQNLKSSGAVRFAIPADIGSSDWAGKTNFWIRARLIGGDYGKEEVNVVTKPIGGGATQQTVDRSTAGIRPPAVMRLSVSYQMQKMVLPTLVLTQDSGSTKDQSDANETPGAIVEAFVPLSLLLGRLRLPQSAVNAAAAACPGPCECAGHVVAAAPPPAVGSPPPQCDRTGSAADDAATAATTVDRCLLLGISGKVADGPVNVLFVVDEERMLDAHAPLQVSALVADRFVSLVASDYTRAIGESGIVSMAVPLSPTPQELFGNTLRWVLLAPKAGGAAGAGPWQPDIRGAYLNAVWASARETLTRELLGSSVGAPHLRVTLARPPVLQGTLELRVKEPLGDEERQAMRDADADSVLSNVVNLPGDWVLWTQVTDPFDTDASARVYALDEASGEITFGDGRNGRIPPIMRDGIVAFRYQRAEPGKGEDADVPGNAIAPRMPLNLVSPLDSVESVIAADQSAGGAPPEPAMRVLRFGAARLRHRERAITMQDFEDLVLQSLPDFVQARGLMRSSGRLQLVVVVRGRDPRPSAAQLRELRALLLAAADPALAAPGKLRIVPPAVRTVRVALKLRVAGLERVGTLGIDVKSKLRALFDTTTGGIDGSGWPLGARPREDDIASALMDVPGIEGIAKIGFSEIGADATEHDLPAALRPGELIVLDDDPLRLEFEVLEALA